MNGDASDDEAPSAEKAAARKRKKIEPEYPERVSDRGNKGMASSTFLADWLSTHYEPRDESEGEVASKVTSVSLYIIPQELHFLVACT